MDRDRNEAAAAAVAAADVGVLHAVQVGAGPDARRLEVLLRELGWRTSVAADGHRAVELLECGRADLLVLIGDTVTLPSNEIRRLVRLAAERHVTTIVVGGDGRFVTEEASPVLTSLPTDVTRDELRGRLAMIEHYRSMMAGLEIELSRMQELTDRLQGHFRELDEELELAGRLQRDFLPDLSRPIRGVDFSACYRPVSRVSGDIFDVFRIDERYTGVYLADAVGHGVAAGLLTMFIKRLIAPARVRAGGAEVVSPSAVFDGLNRALCDQQLPSCQFVTACYGVLDHEAATLTLARAGHPYPLHQCGDNVVELRVAGGMLGVDAATPFPVHRFELADGDRVLFYTDGVEHGSPSCAPPSESGAAALTDALRATRGMSLSGAVESMGRGLEAARGEATPPDDLTLLALEWRRDGHGACGPASASASIRSTRSSR